MSSEPQQTLARSASVSGTSLHTGEKVTLKLQPAPVDSGIKFKRKDLEDEPTIDATIANLKTVERATTIGEGSMRVHTVEHILSSLSAMGVDNAIVEMDANEPPIGDGSARPYVELIKKAGVVAQETPRRVFDRHMRRLSVSWAFICDASARSSALSVAPGLPGRVSRVRRVRPG